VIEILWISVGLILLLGAIIFSFLPPIPGPPLAWFALLLLHITNESIQFSTTTLTILAAITVFVVVIDNFIPIWSTKKMGGSKAGIRGSMVGIFVGLFFYPIGIIIGPMIGAIVAELLIENKDFVTALKSGFGAFIGFLLGIGLKLGLSLYMAILFVKALI
jgi:uncharacterized protein YqgC (DUF456 family)